MTWKDKDNSGRGRGRVDNEMRRPISWEGDEGEADRGDNNRGEETRVGPGDRSFTPSKNRDAFGWPPMARGGTPYRLT